MYWIEFEIHFIDSGVEIICLRKTISIKNFSSHLEENDSLSWYTTIFVVSTNLLYPIFENSKLISPYLDHKEFHPSLCHKYIAMKSHCSNHVYNQDMVRIDHRILHATLVDNCKKKNISMKNKNCTFINFLMNLHWKNITINFIILKQFRNWRLLQYFFLTYFWVDDKQKFFWYQLNLWWILIFFLFV